MPHHRRHRIALRIAALVALVALAGTSGCISNPQALAMLQEQLDQAADAVNSMNVHMSIQQSSIDSLVVVVSKQDTTITRLANLAGVQVVR
ncbi:MAG: hypothetical protein O2973_00465 [Gemmatimonadetes bacterium]|nr:hypothetical protein [Gemmatimonadota bacterium]